MIEYYTGMFTGIICTLVIFSVCSRVFTKQTDQDVVNPTVPRPSIQPKDLKPHRFSCEASLFASCRWKHLPMISVKNTTKASLLYLCLLTLTVSSDVETNPGPDYPCGCCGHEVSDDDQAIDCDSCHTWFHIQCQGIGDDTYKNLLNETSFSLNCITCDHINFSHSSKSFSLASGNSFSILSDSSESDRSHCKSLSYSKPDAAYDRTSSMKILNINCQSIINKRSEFQSVLDLEKPDLVIGTESWLNTDHLDSEIFPRSLGYSSFRRDRASGTKGGGVFILVKDTLVASRQ